MAKTRRDRSAGWIRRSEQAFIAPQKLFLVSNFVKITIFVATRGAVGTRSRGTTNSREFHIRGGSIDGMHPLETDYALAASGGSVGGRDKINGRLVLYHRHQIRPIFVPSRLHNFFTRSDRDARSGRNRESARTVQGVPRDPYETPLEAYSDRRTVIDSESCGLTVYSDC